MLDWGELSLWGLLEAGFDAFWQVHDLTGLNVLLVQVKKADHQTWNRRHGHVVGESADFCQFCGSLASLSIEKTLQLWVDVGGGGEQRRYA